MRRGASGEGAGGRRGRGPGIGLAAAGRGVTCVQSARTSFEIWAASFRWRAESESTPFAFARSRSAKALATARPAFLASATFHARSSLKSFESHSASSRR